MILKELKVFLIILLIGFVFGLFLSLFIRNAPTKVNDKIEVEDTTKTKHKVNPFMYPFYRPQKFY